GIEKQIEQPKIEQETLNEFKESASRTERILLSTKADLEKVQTLSPEIKCETKQEMAEILLAHIHKLDGEDPNTLIERYNANKLSPEAIRGLELTLVQADAESITVLNVMGELERITYKEEDTNELLRAIKALDEVIQGNSSALQEELLKTAEQLDDSIEPLQSRFKKLFYKDKEKLEALEKPEIQELFNGFENEINNQNQDIERDREMADKLSLEIYELENGDRKNELNKETTLIRLKTKLAPLKQDYSQAILDKALKICSHPDLDFDLEEKTEVLSYILEKYNKYTAIDHCFGMCKDVKKLVEQFFGKNKPDQAVDTEVMRQKLARDLKSPSDTAKIDFVMNDIENDPILRCGEIQAKLMDSLRSESVANLSIQMNLGARLHNIGKICVPLSFIDGGNLSESQFKQVTTHVVEGVRILKEFGFPKEIIAMALYHHTKKQPYKDLIKSNFGIDIDIEGTPIQAKLIEIIDIYNALTTPRSYRPIVLSRLSAMNNVKNEIGNDDEYKELFKLFMEYLCNNA
ncbi:MAG: HD domain-containing protein, partial [Candidatus Falkowbacteria bacterium]|nr:HD domain-containing protein [Candidatus Falkowbacteria bacterium]